MFFDLRNLYIKRESSCSNRFVQLLVEFKKVIHYHHLQPFPCPVLYMSREVFEILKLSGFQV